ncbi:Aspartate--tRNA(Asp/Asn) ligase [Labeo rohita]|uniref:Aspartate--tRNA(Asp/Asn) ligase n=1 Tax=Labeo rohita TaxID=84645 RepID=A0ABQ8LVK0_LABRO|nr:Aspartate--tRNA(Asp/Asn) ligase [Labeo rohita]
MSKAKSKTDKSKLLYKPYVPLCSCFIPRGDTHSLCVVCLGVDHAESALEGPAFLVGLAPLPPRRSGSCTRGVRSWICWREWRRGSEARSAVSSPPGTASEEVESECVEVAPHSPQYEELLEVVTRAVAKLNIDWPAEKQAEPQRSKLDERFLCNRPPSSHRSLPFFPDLHTEVSRSWVKPFSARLFVPVSDYYGNVAGTTECGYRAIPWVEQTLASYLSRQALVTMGAWAYRSPKRL